MEVNEILIVRYRMYIIWKVTWVNSFRCAEDQACGHFKILVFYSKIINVIKNIQDKFSQGQFIINITTRAFDQTQLVFLFSLHTKPNQTKHGNHASRKSYKQISVFILVKPSSFEELLGFHIPLILTNTQEFMIFSFGEVVNTIIVKYFNSTEHYLHTTGSFILDSSNF